MADLRGAGSFDAELADRVAGVQQLVDADSPGVAGVTAITTANGVEELFGKRSREVGGNIFISRAEGNFAFGTQAANEALRDDTFDGARTEVRLDPHINESCEGAGGVIRVQRAEDQVPCQRRLDRALGGFVVSNFTDQQLVRVLTKDGTKTHRKSISFFILHLALGNTD